MTSNFLMYEDSEEVVKLRPFEQHKKRFRSFLMLAFRQLVNI
ncbi:hypothetical protein B834_57 [Enterococcus mundtii 1A]|nr:hypothetical protein AK89_00330 [Enterococcus mundtii CRL35]MDA9427611.1 hypothetical protein [Enterococcus mundtii 1A]